MFSLVIWKIQVLDLNSILAVHEGGILFYVFAYKDWTSPTPFVEYCPFFKDWF